MIGSMKWISVGLLVLFFVLVITSRSHSRRRRRVRRDWAGLHFKDCGTDNDRSIRFLDVRATPMPVIVPGTLWLSTHTNVTYDLPRRLNLRMELNKIIWGLRFHVPCFGGELGSCYHENICYTLEHFERNGCPRVLSRHNVPCHCPFYSGELVVNNLAINLPRVSGVAGYLLNGNYEAKLTITGENSTELGCLELKFSIKKRNRGWFFRV